MGNERALLVLVRSPRLMLFLGAATNGGKEETLIECSLDHPFSTYNLYMMPRDLSFLHMHMQYAVIAEKHGPYKACLTS